MKRTYTISLGGQVFHVEEDAYATLQTYLERIHAYFDPKPEGGEVCADIEARIAEIFGQRLGTDRQAVNADDVAAVITTLGTVEDFAEADGEAAPASAGSGAGPQPNAGYAQANAQQGYSYTDPNAPRTPWRRDKSRSMVAGVLSGLAATLRMDPLWLRLAYVGLIIFFAQADFDESTYGWLRWLGDVPGALIIGYIALAILMPKAAMREEDRPRRRFFREPQGQVVGGVAGGLAAYLGIDVVLVRVLFVVFLVVGGTGLIAYLLLWALAPPARSMTDRMAMHGEPITLSSINDRFSSGTSQAGSPQSANTGWQRVAYAPFAVGGAVLRGTGAIAKGLVRLVAGFVGFIVIIVGFAVAGSFVSILSTALTGTLANSNVMHIETNGIDWRPFVEALPTYVLWAAGILGLVIGVQMLVAGASLIAARKLGGWAVEAVLGGIAIVCIVLLFIGVPGIVSQYSKQGTVTTSQNINLPARAGLHVAVPETDGDAPFRTEALRLQPAEADSTTLLFAATAHGETVEDARNWARQITYATAIDQDSLLRLPDAFTLAEGKPYHFQNLKVTLRVPKNVRFYLDEEAASLAGNALDKAGLDADAIAGQALYFDDAGKLKCQACPANAYHGDEDDHINGNLNIDDEDLDKMDVDNMSVTLDSAGVHTHVKDGKTHKRYKLKLVEDTAR